LDRSKKSALTELPGVEPPAPPADLLQRVQRRRRLSKQQYIDGILRGDRVILGRAITLIESTRREDADLAQDILEACLPSTGQTIRVGITGVPGAGKSTLIESLGTHLTRERAEKVAVLAVDPSSELSGGSILGDKTRMERLASDDRAFIRPSPSGGSLGGVARKTRETMLLCEAAGYRNILVETVGVGQSETAVRSMVDFFLLIMIAGAGDELQGMKRGITEMTDLIAINKADGDNRSRADRARREYDSALHLFAPSPTGWSPRVVTCSAETREGVPELWSIVLEHNAALRANGWLERRRRGQVKKWMNDMIEWGLRDRFRGHPDVESRLPTLETEVAEGRVSPFRAAQQLLDLYDSRQSESELL
jgi:LAO/AO transport system kinase